MAQKYNGNWSIAMLAAQRLFQQLNEQSKLTTIAIEALQKRETNVGK
jgi:hypothetical protein